MRLLPLINALFLGAAGVFAQNTLTSEQEKAINEWKGTGQITYASDDSRAATILYQLARFTEMQYPVLFRANDDGGSAHFAGLVIIDQASINKDRNVLAFIIAHEWAHQLLGHQPNIYRTNDGVWKYDAAPAQSENEADVYAGKFLAVFGYDANVVCDYLSALPESDRHTQSTGKKRAEMLRQGYTSVSAASTPLQHVVEGVPQRDKTITVKCTHLMHSMGDEIPCTHIAHPGGHLVRCKHACGAILCHLEGDIEPCTHPLHYNGDRVPCTHLLHPSGDVQKTRNE